MKKKILYLLALSVVLINGCQKELSFETSNSPSHGSLQSAATGDCFPKTINGIYEAGKPLVAATNTVSVSVDVIKTGSYTIFTDTVNGYYFRGTGIFTSLGIATITLQGNGTPFTAGPNNFVVQYDSSICDLQIIVAPAGAGAPADYTLGGAGGSCTTPIINGTYSVNTALNGTNTVVLNINVTTIGTYNISTTTTNGMNFNGSGSFVITGPQTVTLNGSGIPATAGNTTIPVTVNTATCSFVIPVSDGAAGTLGGGPGACTPSMVNGAYAMGAILTPSNTVQVQLNVTTAGAYNITTNTVAGIRFSGSGTVTAGPNQLILLTGTGTPTASGPQTFTVTFGTSTCTFTVNIGAGAAYTPDCSSATEDGIYTAGVALNATNFVDIDFNVTSTGPYTITTTATNGMVFSASGTFATTGVTTVTLTGSGTPTTAGTFNIPVPGTTSCTFPLDVDAAATIDWKFTEGSTTYQGSFNSAQLSVAGSINTLAYTGANATDVIVFALVDFAGGINNNETYNSANLASNSSGFLFNGPAVTFTADNSTAGVSLIFRVTNHTTSTKTITGTFSGTVKDASNVTKTITNGTFTGTYL